MTTVISSNIEMVSRLSTDLLIGGVWQPGSTGKRIDVVDPSTTRVIATVADAQLDDANRALEAAAAALPLWAARSGRERSEILRRCFDLMIEREDELAALITAENGKTLSDSLGEVRYAAEFFRWYAEEAVRISGELKKSPGGSNRIVVEYQPIGVAVLVTPWNFPAAMATRKIAPALAAGCSVILKPATLTPLTAYAIAEILMEAGVPAGVVNVLTTSKTGSIVSSLLHDPRVRALSFTGSTEVGRLLLKESADQVLKCSMELGGNAPFIVFDDADLDAAVDGLMVAKMRNGGQACTAANRIYVHNAVRDRFVALLGERMGSLVVGAGSDPQTECGPVVDEISVDRIADVVAEAVREGATIITGGRRPDSDGYFYLPTVLNDVTPDSRLMREEIFGPVASVVGFDSEDEAIAAANSTNLGLASYLYTGDLARGMRVAEQIESGMVGINRGLLSDPAAPFGGIKQSGLGREGSHDGLHEFTEAKYIAVDW